MLAIWITLLPQGCAAGGEGKHSGVDSADVDPTSDTSDASVDPDSDTGVDTGEEPFIPCSSLPYVAVDVGYGSLCGVHSDGCLDCADWKPQPGTYDSGDWVDHGLTSPPAGAFETVTLSDGATTMNTGIPTQPQYGACGLDSTGWPSCWGQPFDDPSSAGAWVDVPVEALTDASMGYRHACGIRTDGSLVCWGDCQYDACSPPEGSFENVESGMDFSCALSIDGTVACWGLNPVLSNLDDEGLNEWQAQLAVWETERTYVSLSTTPTFVCALDDAGESSCISYLSANPYEHLWSGTPNQAYTATWAGSNGIDGVCGIETSGVLTCNAELADEIPVDLLAPYHFVDVSAYEWFICGVTTDGKIVCALTYGRDAFCPFCTELYNEE